MSDPAKLTELVEKDRMRETIRWLTTQTPYRLAGSPCCKKAADYVCERMRAMGLEVQEDEFFTYNSQPLQADFTLLEPVRRHYTSLPCAHIRSTKPQGEEFEVVYVGDGAYERYRNVDVSGKLVLVEVSYAPPVPEKARIASEMGAAGIICMNWGNDEGVICNRGLKGVWGNPTPETVGKIPDLIGIGITRTDGLELKQLCESGHTVRVRVTAVSTREWSKVQQPMGILRGNGTRRGFVLVCSHLDAWQPGVTCNATGNATTLEICRILSENRQRLDRDVYFVFWNGHEIAEAAGSTWFVDQYWSLLEQECVMYIHIDSTGVRETELFEIKASEELLGFAQKNAGEILPGLELRSMALKKIGDQSFMGIGVPSVTQRMSFTKEYMEKAHGATLGWWNHTSEDGLDKCSYEILEQDTKATLAIIESMCCVPVLPYQFDRKFSSLQQTLDSMEERYGGRLDLKGLKDHLRQAAQSVEKIQRMEYTEAWEEEYNRFVVGLCRKLTNVFQTYADKYQQDSYGYSKLSSPIPLLADLPLLEQYPEDSMEYGLVLTQLIKNRNRIDDALLQICESARVFQKMYAMDHRDQ